MLIPNAIAIPLGAACAAALIAAGSTTLVLGRHYDTRVQLLQSQHALQLAAIAERSAAERAQIDTTYREATHAARQRESALVRSRDAARAESDGLRELSAAAARRLAAAPPAAALEYATTAGELLADCSRDYAGMAAKADGHASDAVMLRDAWPGAAGLGPWDGGGS
jgi:hypothetical protein